ncbi:hypothetical protein [Vibrio methylphosphonaticus]|uniref:hypothetical protein n=1 Tax=Vibrio methylphosphonaticus TaxID=2946866 RepID=UPI00202A8618|nr:hypothetical protein [Vibrio methylphosphonaticus]MCL9774203.1 hypothetical protein [Vibrio methylphosphonaticus]
MNDKMFEIWQKKRELGFVTWLYKSTLVAVCFYLIFSSIFQYSVISQQGIWAFLQSQLSNYALFTALITATNAGLWFYRESSYKKEARRRNLL